MKYVALSSLVVGVVGICRISHTSQSSQCPYQCLTPSSDGSVSHHRLTDCTGTVCGRSLRLLLFVLLKATTYTWNNNQSLPCAACPICRSINTNTKKASWVLCNRITLGLFRCCFLVRTHKSSKKTCFHLNNKENILLPIPHGNTSAPLFWVGDGVGDESDYSYLKCIFSTLKRDFDLPEVVVLSRFCCFFFLQKRKWETETFKVMLKCQ